MVSAPVGFQCPECAAAGVPIRQPTTVVGGALTGRPLVTYGLIALDVLVFGAQYLVGVNDVSGNYGMWPIGVAANGEWWRLLTSAFLHGSILHLIFNMYVLFAFGPTLERILGHWRFVVLFLMSALGGSVASFVFSDVRTVSVGASGAIFGLMGALVIAGRRLRFDITQVLVLIGINVAIGFFSAGTDWRAHLGGLATGAAMAVVFILPERHHRTLAQVLGTVAVLTVLVGLAVWRTQQIQALLASVGVV
jgi:membrane associated rhomboid family serine protease